MNDTHIHYMHTCLQLGKQALAQGNPPVGAILVHQDKIIGQGIEAAKTNDDVTDHAEILAVRNAIKNGYKDLLAKAVMYTTHEPCLMCAYVIRHHRIPQIVYGIAVDCIGGHSSRFDVLCDEEVASWGKKPVIIGGVCAQECQALTEDFRQMKK